jgi:hypothetical protein
VRDRGDRRGGIGQPLRRLRKPQALHGLHDALARQRAVDAMKMKRRQMRHRGEALQRVVRAGFEQNRLDHAGDPSAVVTFGAGLHHGARIAASLPQDGAELAKF